MQEDLSSLNKNNRPVGLAAASSYRSSSCNSCQVQDIVDAEAQRKQSSNDTGRNMIHSWSTEGQEPAGGGTDAGTPGSRWITRNLGFRLLVLLVSYGGII